MRVNAQHRATYAVRYPILRQARLVTRPRRSMALLSGAICTGVGSELGIGHLAKGGSMSPGRIFDIVAIACFAVAAIPWAPQPPVWVPLGLIFFTLGHLFP